MNNIILIYSIINFERRDTLLRNQRHIRNSHVKIISSRRTARDISDLDYFQFIDNTELNTPARKITKAKAKVILARRAENSLV